MSITLPLIDNCLFIDNSTLELLQTCPRACQYSFINKRIINRPNPAQNFGSGLHVALETRYRDFKNAAPSDEMYQAQCRVMEKHFNDNPQDPDEARSVNWALDLVKKYNEIYATEPFNILIDKDGKTLCELPFSLPLMEFAPNRGNGSIWSALGITQTVKIIYTGRIDLPVMWDNGIWVIDHKTTSQLGDRFFDEKQMSAQQIGYCWAFEQLTGQKVRGFCINAIRTGTMPAKPKNGIEAWWRETLQRQRYEVTPEQIIEWKANVEYLIREFFFHYEAQYFPMKTVWCSGKYGKCQYFGCCSYPQDKREMILQSEEYKNNDWSPLKQNNEKEKE